MSFPRPDHAGLQAHYEREWAAGRTAFSRGHVPPRSRSTRWRAAVDFGSITTREIALVVWRRPDLRAADIDVVERVTW